MVELARRHGQGPTSLAEVADVQGLSLPYLERIVPDLRRANLLESTRGAHGGYELTRAPASISVSEVFVAVEGGLIPLDCMRSDGAACARESVCATRSVWTVVTERLQETLGDTSLADVLV